MFVFTQVSFIKSLGDLTLKTHLKEMKEKCGHTQISCIRIPNRFVF